MSTAASLPDPRPGSGNAYRPRPRGRRHLAGVDPRERADDVTSGGLPAASANRAAEAGVAGGEDPGIYQFLDPLDLMPPEYELPGPEWPAPSWPGFAGRTGPSYSFTLATSDWYRKRYPDGPAGFWDVLAAGEPDERHPDPEPDWEAEP